jgi:hypothetical protein
MVENISNMKFLIFNFFIRRRAVMMVLLLLLLLPLPLPDDRVKVGQFKRCLAARSGRRPWGGRA